MVMKKRTLIHISTPQTTSAEHKTYAKEMERYNNALLDIVGEVLNKIQR
ncbi:hypothetical protein [Prevotella sp.]|jgi:hypothetical protein|nr:hypothetical protein [Prevotella sp.]